MLARRSSLVLFVFVLVAWLTGCAPRIHVISQTTPNPMHATSTFTLEPLTFDDLHVGRKTDAEYGASMKKDPQGIGWEGDKEAIATSFALSFSDFRKEYRMPEPHGTSGDYVVKANCSFIEPGYFAAISNEPSRVRINVKIFEKDGRMVDEIDLEGRALTADKRVRLKAASVEAGMFLAEYLKKRTTI